jgi:hypothetical protein
VTSSISIRYSAVMEVRSESSMPVTTAPAQAVRSGFTAPVPAPANHPLSIPTQHLPPSCPESALVSTSLDDGALSHLIFVSFPSSLSLRRRPSRYAVAERTQRAPPHLHDPYAGSEDADSRMTRGCERAKNGLGPIVAPAAPSPLAARTSTSTLLYTVRGRWAARTGLLHDAGARVRGCEVRGGGMSESRSIVAPAAPTSTFPSVIGTWAARPQTPEWPEARCDSARLRACGGGGRRAARAVSTGEGDGGDEQGTGGTRAARTWTPR